MPRVSTVKPDGAEIKIRRERAGLTQAELAELLSQRGPRRGRKVISNLERGNQAVASLRFIAQIARALDVEPESLIKSEAAEAGDAA
jgi:transcriptional regulator with XRE-family HTH domain